MLKVPKSHKLIREAIRGILLESDGEKQSNAVSKAPAIDTERLSKVVDNQKLMAQAFEEVFGKNNDLLKLMNKRTSILDSIHREALAATDIKDPRPLDKEHVGSLKKELSNINKKIVDVASEKQSLARKWISLVEDSGGYVPDEFKKSFDNEVEDIKKSHAESDEGIKNNIDAAEKLLADREESAKKIEAMMKNALDQLDKAAESNPESSLNSLSSQIKVAEEKKALDQAALRDCNNFISQLSKIYDKAPERESEEERDAYDSIIGSYYDRGDKITKQEEELHARLGQIKSPQESKKFFDSELRPFYKKTVANHIKDWGPTYKKFFATVKSPSKGAIEGMLQLLKQEKEHFTGLINISAEHITGLKDIAEKHK